MDRHSYRHEPLIRREARRLDSPFGEPPYMPLERKGAKESLREVLRILHRRKWTILLTALVVLGLVGAYVAFSAPDYQTYTILMVEEPQSSESEDPLSSGIVDALGRREPNMADQLLLLKQSWPVAMQTARRLQAVKDSLPGPVTALAVNGGKSSSLADVARNLQDGYISAQREDQLEGKALRVTATSTNPHEAVFIANAYAEEYVKHALQTSRRRIETAQSFLENQRDQYAGKLQDIEDRVRQYMSQTGAAGLDEETRQTVQQMAALEAQLDEARVENQRGEAALRSVEQELEEIRPRLAERVSSGVDEEISRTQNRIADLETRLEQIYIMNPGLRNNLPQNEDVTELRDHIDELKNRVNQLTEQYIGEIMAVGGTEPFETQGGTSVTYVAQLKRQAAEERVAISGAEAKIDALQQRLAQYEQRMENIPERSIQLAQLRREQMTAETVYTSLNEKLEEVRLANEARIAMADIVRPALTPEDPARSRSLLLLAGILLGLSLGVIAAVARHKLDSRVYTPEDLHECDFITLGVIPNMYLVDKKRALNGQGNASEVSTVLAVPQETSSAITEAYRRLYISVLFNRPNRAVQTILVTSPEPGAGKSTTAINLAVTAARAGARTLIVDADLRKPQVYNLLGKDPGPFLMDLLEETKLDARELATNFDNLFAVTIREPLADADVVLSSGKMADLVKRLRSAFDIIVFDSPPVLSVADALFLSSQCDVTVVVASAGQTEMEALEQTTGELHDAGAEVIGTVLNRFNPSESSRYSYDYRYQDYGYKAAVA